MESVTWWMKRTRWLAWARRTRSPQATCSRESGWCRRSKGVYIKRSRLSNSPSVFAKLECHKFKRHVHVCVHVCVCVCVCS